MKEHPVVQRLVETRMYLEKIRPIDKKLRYQIDKLLQAAHAAGDLSGQDAGDLALRANPGETQESQRAGGGHGVGRPRGETVRSTVCTCHMGHVPTSHGPGPWTVLWMRRAAQCRHVVASRPDAGAAATRQQAG